MGKRIDLTGQRFGRLTVVSFSHKDLNKNSYWNCVCDCGNEKIILAGSLRSGDSTSCGCYRREILTGDGLSSARSKYHSYRNNAKNRNYSFEITFEQFYEITQQDCVYCGASPSNKHKDARYTNTFTYNGIDRRDNTVGYKIENCYPCCIRCNYAKSDMTHDEYIALCQQVAARWNTKETA